MIGEMKREKEEYNSILVSFPNMYIVILILF